MSNLRTFVTFASNAFNTTASLPHFINPGNFGDDLAQWMVDRLNAAGIEGSGELGQEDFGWYLSFRCGGVEHDLVLGYREGNVDESGEWIAWVERRAGCIPSLMGARNRGIRPEAVKVVHDVLAGAQEIRNVRWHHLRDAAIVDSDSGAPDPFAP